MQDIPWHKIDKLMRLLVRERQPVEVALDSAIDLAKPNLSPRHVKQLRAIDYHGEVEHLVAWLRATLTKAPPARGINGLHIGICMTVDERGSACFDFYVCGSRKYSAREPGATWAVNPAYFPKVRYAGSEVLATIGKLIGSTESYDAQQIVVTAYAISVVRELADRLGPRVILGNRKAMGFGTGLDSGEFYNLGQYSKRGWMLPT